ncbi:hypothetical protein [Dinghuibacter silviterrae]|uniref:Uncharacterized protein n=1 Tax=Dinghuibacter silviterrae TaxID=1539049 RepID=A0A4R8DIW2_9BACT|nr:hypothetical protein [Dinghuibacter silviterrae]TDW97116.1 hypothetical protein EDB95_4957 [Dinghuibacter silviterrae]
MKGSNIVYVVSYLLLTLGLACYFGYHMLYGHPFPNADFDLMIDCIIVGSIGATLYCLHGVCFNFCVRKDWSNVWGVWYFLRPIMGAVCGGVSYLFLKAGLLVLEAKKEPDASDLGFLAFAFIAGLNVDKFLKKIEDLAKATWGIEKSKQDGDRDEKH